MSTWVAPLITAIGVVIVGFFGYRGVLQQAQQQGRATQSAASIERFKAEGERIDRLYARVDARDMRIDELQTELATVKRECIRRAEDAEFKAEDAAARLLNVEQFLADCRERLRKFERPPDARTRETDA